MPRKKHPREWFKLYANTRHVFDSLSDEAVGQAVKYALHYFVTGEEPPDTMGPITRIGFDVLRSAADEAIADYEEAVANGSKGPVAKAAKMESGEGG